MVVGTKVGQQQQAAMMLEEIEAGCTIVDCFYNMLNLSSDDFGGKEGAGRLTGNILLVHGLGDLWPRREAYQSGSTAPLLLHRAFVFA